jgi:site-specific DNA-cytosine methylase
MWPDVMLDNASGCMFYSEAAFNWIFKSEKRKGNYFEYSKETRVKMQMIEASHSKGYSNQRCFGINDGGLIRYIHPIECERMQTVPDNYTAHASNTQRYRMLGNGWTVDVIAHIFKSMPA